MNTPSKKRWWVWTLAAVALAGAGQYAWQDWQQRQQHTAGLVSGNGRTEATEIDIATKLGGRVQQIAVQEGELVQAGQTLAQMQVDTLLASLDEARAHQQQAITGVASAQAQLQMRQSEQRAAQALLVQRQSELQAAQQRLARSSALVQAGATSAQEADDDQARVRNLQAALSAAQAQVDTSSAAIHAARSQIASAQASVSAAQATVARLQAEIADHTLTAPRNGRVQYRIAQAGEVLGAGGKLLNLLDVSDVYMGFFVPETVAGQLVVGSEVRLVLDALPQYVIPARLSFVASTAQFTPKTVETSNERQKLMFRVKAQLAPELLQQHPALGKVGLPGVAWLKPDTAQPWPAHLAIRLPE
ncbi:MAG: HlyD family efflux transporter periplasmic adaptor subunit [Giesbergeria sp.]|uniref:HlyD family secretion protein n=1 Tax=Giesbergeria sp. TaxID=2818473 RepID=UPI00260E2303|nr:efflux RND transporter periplasmic adaptor subunit [Giesbergeria sp.]MDD2608919.1 HlyD family efflux transporter periplasmic adaptor subunit [Giesbergeria sp.]